MRILPRDGRHGSSGTFATSACGRFPEIWKEKQGMNMSQEEFRRLGYKAVDMAAHYFAELPHKPVFQRMKESERQAVMNMPLPAAPMSGDEILRLLGEQIMPHPMGNGHPRFFGWVNSPPAMLSVITEILAAA